MTIEKKKHINISDEAYKAIYDAIEEVYANTNKKPKYSEIQALYQTSNSYILHVLSDWMEKRKDDLGSDKQESEAKPIELTEQTQKNILNSFIAEVSKERDLSEMKLESERKAIYEIRDEAVAEMHAAIAIADDRLHAIDNINERFDIESQKVLELEKSVATYKTNTGDLKEQIKHINEDLMRANVLSGALRGESDKAKSQLNLIKSEATSAKMQLDEMTARNERLTAELETNKLSHNNQLEQRDTQIAQLTEQVGKLSKESISDSRRIATLEGREEALERDIKDSQDKLIKASDEISKRNEKISNLETKILQSNNEILNRDKQIERLDIENKRMLDDSHK